MRIKSLFLLAAIALAPTLAFARGASEPQALKYPLGTLVDDVALNAAAATRTASVLLEGSKAGYDIAIMHIDLTHTAATDVQMSCTITPSAADSAGVLQQCAVSAGACTSSDASWTKAVSGDKVFLWRVDISGFPGTLACVLSGTSAGANDKVTVKGWLVTK